MPPPSHVSGLAREADIPVDLYTGLPQINIPLYVINGHKLSYPISLSYNASGIKVNEIAGHVGLGWTLHNGGIITRTVRGRPDEWPGSFFEHAPVIPNENDPIDSSLKLQIADGNKDMIPDLFYYNTGISGGKFIFNNQLKPITIPRQEMRIVTDNTSTLNEFTLTAPDGTKFVFISGETASIDRVLGTATYNSSWYLSKIIAVDNTDEITFNYTTIESSEYEVALNGYLYLFYDMPDGAAPHAGREMRKTFDPSSVTVTGARLLESISYSGGKVLFRYGTRTDDESKKKLESIIVLKRNPLDGTLFEEKKVNFTYSYFKKHDTATGHETRLRLDNINEVLPDNTARIINQFFYSEKSLPSVNSLAQDDWGYYNGAISNTTLAPPLTFRGQELSNSDRNVHAECVDGWMLKKIKSELGGETEFVFEPNRYGSHNNYGPGMRVAKIIHRDPFSAINAVDNYEYLNPNTGTSSGVIKEYPSYDPIHLDVKDILRGEELNYKCMLRPVRSNGSGPFANMPIVYEYVTHYKGDAYQVAGKSVFKFTTGPAAGQVFPFFTQTNNAWKAGNLMEVIHYRVNNGVTTPVKKIEYLYNEPAQIEVVKGLNIAWNKIILASSPQPGDYTIKNYYEYSSLPLTSKIKTTDYEQNSATINTSTATNYYYERTDKHLQPTKITTQTSDNNLLIQKEFTYPPDLGATGIFAAMQNLNMISYPVETKTSLIKGTAQFVTDYQKTEYFQFSPYGIYPRYTYTGKIAAPVLNSTFSSDPGAYLRKVASFNHYDNAGFLIERQQQGGTANAIIVDHMHGVVSADIANAQSNQVAYSSFESSDHGNWNLNAGTEARVDHRVLSANGGVTSFTIQEQQTISYTYTVSQSAGPRPVLTISQAGQSDIVRTLVLPSGSGGILLTAGSWNATLNYEDNVINVSLDLSYSNTRQLVPNIIGTESKTGNHALHLITGHVLSKTNLPSGDYVVSFYQKDGSVNMVLSGDATIIGGEIFPPDTDGWGLVKKRIHISSISDLIQISGTNVKIDELRLFPTDALMNSRCFDQLGRIQTETDVNLRSRFYEYDEWGRLRLVRDHEKNILEQREYKIGSQN